MISKVKRVAYFTHHAPTLGAYHEALLRTAISDILPNRFSVKSGFVYAGAGCCSRQTDILVVDENDPSAYFMKQGEFAIVHPRALVCAIEVKTKLTKAGFLGACANLGVLADCLQKCASPLNHFSLLISFDSQPLTPYTLQGWFRSLKETSDESRAPAMIISLSGQALSLRPSIVMGEDWGHYYISGPKDKVLIGATSLFLCHIRKLAEVAAGIDSNPFESAILDGLHWTREFFRPGMGMCLPTQVKKVKNS